MSDDPGYLLDTNTVSDLIRGHAQVSARVRGVPMAQMAISAITRAELEYGLCKRPEAVRLRALVEAFLQRVTVLNWDTQAALGYGQLRHQLEKKGLVVAPLDLLIAAQAWSRGAILVSHDQVFAQVSQHTGLYWQDWRVPAGAEFTEVNDKK